MMFFFLILKELDKKHLFCSNVSTLLSMIVAWLNQLVVQVSSAEPSPGYFYIKRTGVLTSNFEKNP